MKLVWLVAGVSGRPAPLAICHLGSNNTELRDKNVIDFNAYLRTIRVVPKRNIHVTKLIYSLLGNRKNIVYEINILFENTRSVNNSVYNKHM